MAQNNDVEKLYNALKRDGYDDLGTLDEFSSSVADRDRARKLYEAMQRDGYDDLGTADEFYTRLNPQPAYQPTQEELAGFQRTIGQAQQTVMGSQQAARRIGARQQHAQKTNYGLTPGTPKLGQNSKVVETDPHFNLNTGQMESTYITEQGNEYSSRAGADIEQNAVDLANHQMSLPGQLQDAYAERDRLAAEIEAETAKAGYGSSPERSFALQVPGSIPRQSAERLSNDRLQTLYAAQRQNEERIIALEAERDDDGGTQFWRGFLDAAKNPSTWTFGVTDFQNMSQLMRIKGKVDAGEELTDDEQSLLKNTMANGYAQQMFGENRGFMYRAGCISMQALPFVAEFMATGGFSSITQMGANAGTRVAEKFALEGLKKTILRNTGVLMGDIASGFLMANTTGAARTGADIMERNIGHVTTDEEGNYQFEDGKSLARSIYEGEVASTLEYYTEKLGEHLQLGNWMAKGLDKMGLSRLSKAVNYLSSSKALNAGGIQDYPSEVVEEQANLLLNAILVGDNNFSIDPNSKEWNQSVFNPKTQLDIWGGMMFSIGLMQAPRLVHTGYNAAGYYAYKHTTDVADANAAVVFGEENWQMIKEQIDNCDNEHLGELLQTVIDGGMNDVQKTATMNYAGNLLKMRGYNMGMMADVRGGEDFQSEEGFLSHGIDQGYQQGHEAQQPDEKKIIIDEANAAEAQLSQFFSDQDIQWISNTDPMTAIRVMLANRGTGENGSWNDDEIAAVVDYYQKQARAQGVMDAAADDVEFQVAKANAEVDANTHKGLNQMIMAESGGEQFYIVGGEVSLLEDTEEGKYIFDSENTGDAIIVRNAQTGEISVKSPQQLSVSSIESPGFLKQLNETVLRQEVMQQHEDDITFGSPAQEVFQLNDTVTLNDGQGNLIEGEIGMMPSSIDGAYVVYTADGKAMQFTGDELNKMIVAHNGMEVQRASLTPPVEQEGAVLEQEGAPIEQNQPGMEQQGSNAGAEAGREQTSGNETPASALDRIPYLQDDAGKPILNKKGKKQYQWHKASVEDTADALTETTGGDMLMARDTATDLINNAKGKLKKIREQKPKGDDPIEIAESRAEIRRQEQEQQAIIKHWQDVNQAIQNRMMEESAQREAERRAALTEQQRAEEDERKRQEQERQEQLSAERRRQQIEEDLRKWNQPYQPLEQAKREMADDPDAMSILSDTEPQGLDEWVSSLLRPQSMMWNDEVVDGRTVTGLQSELGLSWNDMQRFGALIGGKGKGKPFGQVVHDIWEDLPEGMKNQYDDQDVRNVLLSLFNESDAKRMRNLAAEHRIEQARELMKENQRREAEWEMEAWAEAYHLTPEERETFEDFMQQPPMEPEQEVINQIIAENEEQNLRSNSLDRQPVSGTDAAGIEGGQGQVQEPVEGTGDGTDAQGTTQGAEAATGESPVSDNDVAGGTSARESLAVLFDQIGAEPSLAEHMSDYEVEQLTALVDDWDAINSDYGEVMESQKDALKSKSKAVRDAAQAAVNEAQAKSNEAFEPIEQYVESLQAKYGLYDDKGIIPTPAIDNPRYNALRQALIDAYASGNRQSIGAAVKGIQQYVDEGLDANGEYSEEADDYEGNDPTMLADQYMIHVFQDRYLDDDEDQEYIRTGLKPSMRDETAAQPAEPYTSFEQLVSDTKVTVTDNERKVILTGIAKRIFDVGTSTTRRFPRGYTTQDVIWYGGLRKAERDYLKPWASNVRVEVDDNSKTATWVDDKEQIIYSIRYTPFGIIASDIEAVIITKKFLTPANAKPNGTEQKSEPVTANDAEVQFIESLKALIDDYDTGDNGYITDSDLISQANDLASDLPNGELKKRLDEAFAQYEDDQYAYRYENGMRDDDGTDAMIETLRSVIASQPSNQQTETSQPIGQTSTPEQIASEEAKVEQVNSDGSFDEHKVMYGFASEQEAREAYLSNYSEGWQGLGAITEVSRTDFKKWVQSSHRKTKPFAEYKKVKTAANEILVKGNTILKNNIAGGEAVVKVVGSTINKRTGERQYVIEYYSDEQAVKERIAIADATISQAEMRQHLDSGEFSTERIRNDWENESVPDMFESVSEGDVFVNDNGLTATIDKKLEGKNKAIRIRWEQTTGNGPTAKDVKILNPDNFNRWIADNNMRKQEAQPANASGNRLVTDERYAELKERMKKKLLGQFNMGVDPEILAIGTEMAVYHIEKGARQFVEYAKGMIADLGDAIRPYLKAFYNGARDLPEMAELSQTMDAYEDVSKFDVFNFDKQQAPTPVEKAQQVVSEKKAEREAKEAVEKIQEIAKKGSKSSGKKKQQPQTPSLFDLFEETKADETETKPANSETNEPKTETPAKPQEKKPLKLRPATEADLDAQHPIVYWHGAPYNIIAVMRSGEQISATQFSKPKVDSVMLTNGKSVQLSELEVEDTAPAKPNLDKKDYRTYMTPEAREYFTNEPRFAKLQHRELAFITAAVWDGVVIPVEELAKIPEIVEAEQRVKAKEQMEPFSITDEQVESYANQLLDTGSAVYENGKLKKVDGKEDFSGPVRQERKAFVIIGRPAGGKSSVFANPLSHQHGARIVDSDVVKEWFDEFDDGYGAGYVQNMSSKVAERALDIAAQRGDNLVLPRIGGNSVIVLSVALRAMGYDVQLYYNDVVPDTSYMRSNSRFAMTGRYLSLDYLTSIKGKPSEFFSNFAEKSIGGFLDECTEKEVQKLRGRFESLVGSQRGDLLRAFDGWLEQKGRRNDDGGVSVDVERPESDGTSALVNLNAPIFSYAEWKSNDVAFGEKPKEIWNSESGKPLPGKETNNEAERKVSRKSEQAGQGAEQARGTADRAGEERSPEQNRAERSGSGHSVENTLGVVDAAEQTRSGSINPTARANSNARKAVSPILDNNRRNNVGERGKDYAPLSPKARFNANVDAIRLMRELMEQGIDAPTSEQMEVLRKYSGWGGLGTFFNDEKSAENRLLHDLLSEEEYHDAVLSIKTAYYTPAYVIDTLWDVAKQMGFKGGNVLEGSAGIGNIIGQMPREMSSRSNIEAVEIDAISGNILKLLYPDAKVHIQGFQDTVIRNGSVDLAITNVPFAADLHVIDKTDKDLSRKFRTLHDFCIAKNIRKLREGGIGIFITTSGTLDKSNKLRQWITDEAQTDVIGAFRMHNKSFGGANVTSDIIVVKKRVGGVKSDNAIDIAKASPLRTGEYEAGEAEYKRGEGWVKDIKSVSMVINDYFHDHPEAMAGEMFFGFEKGNTYRPESYGLYPAEGKDQEKMLADWVKGIKEQIGSVSAKQQEEEQVNQLTGEKEGRMLVDDKGRLCVSERGIAVPLALNDQKVKGQTKQQCFKDYQAVQKAVDDVLQQQLSDPDDAALKPKLDALNKAFDLFVKRYGPLHKNTSISFLRNDIDFPSFLALENYSETKDMKGKVTVTTSKSPVFKQRVLGFKTEPQPKTVKDAVTASLFRNNTIDVDWIAEKLGMEPDAVRQEVLSSRLGFEDPTTGSLEIRYKYLSGNVREKLAIAEAYNDSEESKGRYDTNVEELRKAVPMDIPAHLIDFSLGSSWIPMELYTQYMEEVYDLSNVKIAHLEGAWVLDPQYRYHNEKNRVAGVYSELTKDTIYGHQLVAAALNNRPIKVTKQVTHGYGSSKTTETIVDKDATSACAVRVDEIKDEFKQWAKKKMQEDEELSQRIEKIYNEKFNAVVPMQIDDEFLPDIFEGANMNISLYGHQKRGVMRGITSPTMLAHEVGTGKSFTLISTAMEMRRLGTAKKPMIVVQNATVAQMTADAKLLYPNAKILSLSEKDRSAEGRRSFYAKIKYNDWDIIIVPQSTFERIPDSPARELQFIQEKIDEKKHVIEMAEESGMDSQELKRMQRELESLEQEYGDKFLDSGEEAVTPKSKKKDAKKEEAALENAATKAKEMLDRQVDDVQYFDDLGVDALLVDEAHEYKHLGFQTSIGRGIKGIDPSYSKKCAGLYNKTRSVFEKAGWRNVVFATGTPISNTAAEIWTFMKYLMPADVMRQNDIYYFDDFVHNFGAISQMLEFTTSGKFKENTRFAAYLNKPELIRIWSQVADTVLTKEVGKVQEKIPELENGKDQDVFLPQSPSLISIMAAVRAELERFENMSGKEKKENSSIPLTMYGIAKRAAIDPRLVNPDASDEPLSKTNAAVKEIVKDLKATESYKGTVAVFCDNQNRLGNNAAGKKVVEFNIYDDMREKLIAQGVPAEQIAIIKSGMSITAKQKIFDAVNAGSIRVVLGSTQTLGTGVNIQERLHLLIHMDAPDRPMDYTQRNGRIKRQGNLHKTWRKSIRVIRFGVEDSLDVTAYQRLKTKSGFIDSIMDGKGALLNNQVDRTVEEEEEGLFDNPVAVLSGSQYALKKNQAERELRKYQNKRQQYEADQVYVSNTIRKDKAIIAANESEISRSEKNVERIRKMFPDGKVKVITIQGEAVDMTAEGAEEQLSKVIKEKVNDPINALVKRNRENAIYNDVNVPVKIQLDGHDLNISVSIEREMVNEGGRLRTVIHQYTTYECKALGLEAMMRSSERVREILDYVLDTEVTCRGELDRIEALKGKNERLSEEVNVLQERVGLKFQYDNELAEAEKKVEEYTELMKQEMAEKEAKYASVAVDTVDLSKSEDSEDDDTRYRSDDAWEDEENLIIELAKANGTYMRAPNGKPSNLNERQWVQVRTQAFKDWFGDWENDPENASKVVDENGEPLVQYHSTNLEWVNKGEPFWEFYEDSHFGTEGQALDRMPAKSGVKLYAVFLNIRNPQRRNDADQDYLDEKDMTMSEYWEQCARRSKYNGYDGIVYLNEYEDKEHPADSWIAFRPEQVKSADENIGTFDTDDPDIRHRDDEQFADGEVIPVHKEYQLGVDGLGLPSRRTSYSTDLLPDSYPTMQSLLDAIRNAYEGYYAEVNDDQNGIVMRSWNSVLSEGRRATTAKQKKGKETYLERKTRRAIAAVNELAHRLKLDVEVLTTTDGLKGKKARAKGWYNAKTGKITVVLPNHYSQADLLRTLMHEGVAHYGLRQMFGEHFDTFLDNIYNNVSPDLKRVIDAAMKHNGWSQREATEEYLARLAEHTDFEHATQQGWWSKIKEFFMRMLAQAGFRLQDGVTFSDNELRYVLWRSYENLRVPNARRSIFDTAKEIQMQSRFGVGRYAREHSRLQNTGRMNTSQYAAAERYSLRTKEPPKKTGIGYKVFYLHNGQLYPPMVANPGGAGTPVGVWLDADDAPVVAVTKSGRKKVKAGGKGTQGGSGQLAHRPGWHLGTIPFALQFNRGEKVDNPLGITNNDGDIIKVGKYFPNDFVWAEVEYANDENYQDEAESYGYKENGKFQHSLAGLPKIPEDGSYTYRTNPNPATDPWIITGAMRVNRILSREEVADIVKQAGREPQLIQDGDIVSQEAVDALNEEIAAMRQADDMGLLFRDDDDWLDTDVDIARQIYEQAAAEGALKFQEAWQDSMAGLKVLQNAIEQETGNKASGAEDAYLYENRMHGKAKNQSETFDRQYYRPILKALDALMKDRNLSHDAAMQYLIAKHGLERNIFYAFKEAVTSQVQENINKEQQKLTRRYERGEIDAKEYKKLQQELSDSLSTDVQNILTLVATDAEHIQNKSDYENGRITYADYISRESDLRRRYAPDFDDNRRDYSGLTELTGDEDQYEVEALAMVMDVEDNSSPKTTRLVNSLWNTINAATKESLRFSYESGQLSRTQYNNIKQMFEYYVPLRGWAEDNADDAYDYVTQRNVFSTAVKKTYGRKSVAENPIAYIGNMAVSTILAGHRNLMKQHFLNYVMNNTTSLVSISEQWWENKGSETSPYWVEVRPEIPAGASADEIADIVEAFNEDMKEKQKLGMAMNQKGKLHIKYHATASEKNEHMVEVQRNGKTYQLYINGNPKAAQALNGANSRSVTRITDVPGLGWIPKLSRMMAANFTSRNPAFIISNMSRDLNMAGASVAVKEDAAYNARFIANVAKVLSPRVGRVSRYGLMGRFGSRQGFTGLMPSLMRKYLAGELNPADETERYFKEFMDEGAETGFVNMLSVDSFKDKMVKELGRMQGTTFNPIKARKGTKEMHITKGLRMMGEIFEFYNRCAEDATRFIVYMTSRQMGKTLEDSVADAKDVTLNFNRKGTGAMMNGVIRDLFIFTNPAIQALANMYKMAYKHPLKLTAVTAAFVAGGMLMPVINQWLLQMFGDGDDKDAYWNLPPWVRKNNLVMWIPGTKNFITIPLAQEFRVFYGMGEMTSSLIYEHPVHNWPLEITSSFMDLVPINPTGNAGKLSIDLMPTVFQPLMQIGENTDFTGKPLWKENQGNKWAPMYTKAYASTPAWMVDLAHLTNEIGGNEGRKGWIEEYSPFWGNYVNNPAVWNHLLQGYFGGMYNTVAKAFDVGVTAGKGEVPKVYQTPIINRFLNRPVERDNGGALGEEYYSLIAERDKVQYEVRTWKRKAAEGDEDAQRRLDALLQSERYKRAEVISHYDKIMKDLKAGERAIKDGAPHSDKDLHDIQESMQMYKLELLEELSSIGDGKSSLDAAIEKFNSARSFAEKNKLRLRIERLMMQQDNGTAVGRNSDVEKAVAYLRGEEVESRKTSELYLSLATGQDIADDARIRAAKARIKQVTDKYKELKNAGRGEEAAAYREQHADWFAADGIIGSQQRGIASNKKLLGKGYDANIMKLIAAQRERMLKAIEGLE